MWECAQYSQNFLENIKKMVKNYPKSRVCDMLLLDLTEIGVK